MRYDISDMALNHPPFSHLHSTYEEYFEFLGTPMAKSSNSEPMSFELEKFIPNSWSIHEI